MSTPPPPAVRGPSRRPYLLRAMHEWMSDAGFTPHVIVDVAWAGVEVPKAYVKDGKIVLNLSWSATQNLRLGNDCVEFNARFGGVSHAVRVPIGAVLGIYARETGEGMVFSESDPEPPPGKETSTAEVASATPGGEKGPTERRRPKLQVVK